MPNSGSLSATDCRRLEECPGEVSVHAWSAFTPIPWHSLLAPAREALAGGISAQELDKHRVLSRGNILVTPNQLPGLQHGGGGQHQAGARVAARMRCIPSFYSCFSMQVAQPTSPEASWLPCVPPAFNYLLKWSDTRRL